MIIIDKYRLATIQGLKIDTSSVLKEDKTKKQFNLYFTPSIVNSLYNI